MILVPSFWLQKYHTVIMGISQQGFRTGDPYDYGGLNLIYVNTIIMNNHRGAGTNYLSFFDLFMSN